MNGPIRCRAVLLAAACVVLLAGCPVPIPPFGYSSTSRDNLPDKVPAFIVKGTTTREDVLLTLGAPDSHSPDGHWFAYRSERHTGGIVFVVGAAYSAGGVGVVGYDERLLTVRFDERAIVIDATLENRICPRGVVASSSGGSAAPPCLKLPDLTGGPRPELSRLRTVYVVKAEGDAEGLDQLFVAALRRKGLDATAGPAGQARSDVDAILTYRTSTTDPDTSIVQLTALLQAPGSPEALALTSSERVPPLRKTPEEMVTEALANIFTGSGRPFLTLPPYKPEARQPTPASSAKATVHIEPVRDARGAPRGRFIGERSALGLSIGLIDVAPLPVEIVGQLLHEELALLGHREVASGADVVIDAQLAKFEIRTPSTLVYWDVNGVVAVDLGVARSAGARQELRYEANCSERTYVALSEPMIRGVVLKCLAGLGAKVREDPALARLLAGK